MLDYLNFISELVDIHSENAHSLIICNRDGYIEYLKSYKNPFSDFTKSLAGTLVGRHILEVYENLTEETSTIMETLRTGQVVTGKRQQLTVDESTAISVVSTTVPIIINDEILGAIDYTQICGVLKNNIPVSINQLVTLDSIITKDPAMLDLKDKVQRVSWSDSPVLIYGETGTGKELIAESIHTVGKRCQEPFISQNCAAVPTNLLESIFFGTEKGSFTGAESRKGLFELADGGTLFLDEINSMDIDMQVKLLKALEEKKVRRIGGNRDIFFNVRIVCASNELPEVLIREGRMREDLYYRVSVIQLEIPPLRKRRGDILLLAEYFISLYNRQMGRNIKGLSDMVTQIFENAGWPGNVRQLKNVIESAFNLAGGDQITIRDIPDILKSSNTSVNASPEAVLSTWNEFFEEGEPGDSSTAGSGANQNEAPICRLIARSFTDRQIDFLLDRGGINLQEALDVMEARLIRRTIEHEGQLNKAARKLSISPQRLHYKLERLNLRESKQPD